MINKTIKDFPKQFDYQPEIQNPLDLNFKKFVLIGMGGSHLAAGLVKTWKPEIDIIIHKNYSLPHNIENRLVILSSYSGNTEEVLDAYKEAKNRSLPIICISTGGKLLENAKKDNFSYIQIPDTGIQPRSALGFSFRALLKALGEENALKETGKLSEILKPEIYKEKGEKIAYEIKDAIPVIYSSEKNISIAYNWKIKINETGKIPAFYNTFPELNHNEIISYDQAEISKNFYFIILKDEKDSPQILKRMEVLEKLLKDRGLRVEVLELKEENLFLKLFSSLVLADMAAYSIADMNGTEPDEVQMIEEFKNLI